MPCRAALSRRKLYWNVAGKGNWSGRQDSTFSTKFLKYIKNMKTKNGCYLPGYQHRIWLEMDPCLPIRSIFSTAQPYH